MKSEEPSSEEARVGPLDESEDVDSTFFRSKAVTRKEFRTLHNAPATVPWVYRQWHKLGQLLHLPCTKQPLGPEDADRCVITGLRTIHPSSKGLRVWRIIIALVDGLYTAFGVPIYAAYAPIFHDKLWYIIVSVTAGVLFTTDLFVNFHAGFVVNWRAKRLVVMKGASISHHYMWHRTFWVDLMSSLPLLIFIVAFPITGSNKVFAIVQLLRLLRLFRLVRLPSVLRRLALVPASSSSGSERKRRVMRAVGGGCAVGFAALYFSAIVINFLGCFWFAVAYVDPSSSWLADVKGMDLTAGPMLDQYVASVYFITATVTYGHPAVWRPRMKTRPTHARLHRSIGYGDITATTIFEMVMAVLIMLIGIVVFGSVIGLLSNVLFNTPNRQRRLDTCLQTLLKDVEEFLYLYSIPDSLCDKVKQFIRNRHFESTAAQDMDKIFFNFPPPLRWEVALAIMNQRQLEDPVVWPPDLVRVRKLLLGYAELENVPLWSDLWRQGEPQDDVVLLQEGVVDVFVGSRHVYTVHAPAWLGNPLHILELGDACLGTAIEQPEAVLQQIVQRVRELGATRAHRSMARVSHHFSAMQSITPEASVHSVTSVDKGQWADRRLFSGVDWGVRGCTARASRGCRVWKVPRWVLEVVASEDPKFAPTLAQCIVDSFDRDIQDMPKKRLDQCSMPKQDVPKKQGRNKDADPADTPACDDDLVDSEVSDGPVNGVHDAV